jgi:maltose phosphorylase
MLRQIYSENLGKYVILGVTGPNEYENNVSNNWYTNTMAVWTLSYTIANITELKKTNPAGLKKVVSKTGLKLSEEIKIWEDIISKMHFPFDEKRRIFLQQDGFLDKELKPASSIPKRERPINQLWSWDRILRSCFIKQADVLQGLYVLEEQYDTETIKRNFDFYKPMTVHESSLSACIHSILASRIGNIKKAYELYLRTARLDLDDRQVAVREGLQGVDQVPPRLEQQVREHLPGRPLARRIGAIEVRLHPLQLAAQVGVGGICLRAQLVHGGAGHG